MATEAKLDRKKIRKAVSTKLSNAKAKAKKDNFYVLAAAGIVADSVPKKEYAETVNKAKALINALR